METIINFGFVKSSNVNIDNVRENVQLIGVLAGYDGKTARRALYDIARMLRGEIAAGKNCREIPEFIKTAVRGPFNKQTVDFSTDKTNKTDGMLFVDAGDNGWFVGYRSAVPTTETTAEKPAATKRGRKRGK